MLLYFSYKNVKHHKKYRPPHSYIPGSAYFHTALLLYRSVHLLSIIMGVLVVVLLGAYLSVFVTSYEFINILGTNSTPSSFPRNFLFGTASSSYQVRSSIPPCNFRRSILSFYLYLIDRFIPCLQFEGGFLADGKGFSNWDIFSHKPGILIYELCL